MKISNPERCASLSVAIWSLRVFIALQCIGVAGQFVLSEYETESDIYGVLFFDFGWPEAIAQVVDDVGACVCLLSAVVLLVNGVVVNWLNSESADSTAFKRFRLIDQFVLWLIGSWTLALAVAHMIRGGAYAELAIGEDAVRIAIPFVMLVLLRGPMVWSTRRVIVGAGILSVATAMTFAVHGYKAQQLYGPFADLVLLSDQRLFHFEIDQSAVERILTVIGWVDILVAVLVLTTRWRIILVYMTCWGLITALSRMTALGVVGWPDTLVRAANAGAPFVLLFLYRHLARLRQSELRSSC